MLRLGFLGEMLVERDGARVALPQSRKTRALLAFLATADRPQRRERLVALFWEVPDDPRGALRWSLSRLRALVDEPGRQRIQASRETVAFDPAGAEIDVAELRRLASGDLASLPDEELARLADLVRGEFLEGNELPDLAEVQAWLLAEREDMRRLHARLLAALVARRDDRPEEALGPARLLVQVDPFSVGARTSLLGLLLRLGRRDEAEQHYEAAQKQLRELGGDAEYALVHAWRRLHERAPQPQRAAAAIELDAAAPSAADGAGPGLRSAADAVSAAGFIAAPAPAAVAAEADVEPAAPVERWAGEQGPSVIVVDDEPDLRSVLAGYLRRHGVEVRLAAGAAELDRHVAERKPEIVLLDVVLPGEDGVSIARRLRAADPQLGLIMLTAAGDVVDRVIGIEVGADDYITKPFNLRELLARIRGLHRRLASMPAATPADEPVPGADLEPAAGAVATATATAAAAAAEPQELPRQEVHFCTAADGVQIAYAEVGEGPPLVKAANWLNHLEFDWQSPVWSPILHTLSAGRRLIRYDARGNGLSDWDVADISFEAFVRDLEIVVDRCGLDRFPLFGCSQGCAISIAYAVRNPERVSHLILYGGFVRGRRRRGPEGVQQSDALLTLMRQGWGQDSPAFRQIFTSLFVPDGTPEQVRSFNELQRVTTSPENAVRIRAAVDNIDITDLLGRVRAPTLVLHCREDAVQPFDEGRRMAAGIPGARFVALDGRNHILIEGDPGLPRFVAELDAFLGS